MQGATIDQGWTTIGIGAGQQPGAGVGLDQCETGAAVVGDPAGNCSGSRAGQDQIQIGRAGIGHCASQGQPAIGGQEDAVAEQRDATLHSIIPSEVDQTSRAVIQEEINIRRESHRVGQADGADIAGIGGHDLFGTAAEGRGTGRHHCATVDINIGGERIVATESNRPAINHGNAASANQPIADGVGIAAGKHDLSVIGHRAGPELAARTTIAHLQRSAADNHEAAVGVVAAEDHCVRAVLGEIAGASQDPGEGQSAAAATTESHIPAEDHAIGDHKAARAVLGDQRGEAHEGDVVARDVLGEGGRIGEIDLFGDQAGQVIDRSVAAVGGSTKTQHQIGGEGWRHLIVLPLIRRAESPGRIGPGKANRARIIQKKAGVVIGQCQTPGAVEGVGEAGQIQAEGVGRDPARGCGDREAVVAVLVKVGRRQRGDVDGERVAAGGRVGQRACDVEQIPSRAGRAGRVVNLPNIVAAATQRKRAGGAQGGRPGSRAGGDRAAVEDLELPGAVIEHQRSGPGEHAQIGDHKVVLQGGSASG